MAKRCELSPGQQRKVKALLCIRVMDPFPRCHARDMQVARKLEEDGDPQHVAENHICEVCRCKRVAGEGTRGDHYGMGWEVGHYGCGYCNKHERMRPNQQAQMYWRDHMAILQSRGNVDLSRSDFEIEMREKSHQAEAALQIREGMDMIKTNIAEFQRLCEGKTLTEDGTEVPLTEKYKDGPGKISDKSRFELAMKFAKLTSDLAMDKYKIDSVDLVHLNEVTMRLYQTISMTKRYVLDPDKQKEWSRELRDIWSKVPATGVRG
jgi:hypothetical protein